MKLNDLNMNYVVRNYDIEMIVPMVYSIESILVNFNFSPEQIRKIMTVGGLDLGGLRHLESRCFNYALSLLIGEQENRSHCTQSLRQLRKQMTMEDDPFEILERIIE